MSDAKDVLNRAIKESIEKHGMKKTLELLRGSTMTVLENVLRDGGSDTDVKALMRILQVVSERENN